MIAAYYSVLFMLVSKFSLSLSLGHLFVVSHISVKRWPSDKVKENCEINLKVHCGMQLSLSYRVYHRCRNWGAGGAMAPTNFKISP